MKITRVTAQRLECPVAEGERNVSDYGPMETLSTVLVRIETDAGITGIGETKAGGSPASADASIAAIINGDLGPQLIGEDPRDITRLWEKLYNGKRADAAARAGRAMPALGRRGLSICALGGIDIALWDLLGKATGQPVWRLLGGKTKPTLPVYASGGWGPAEKIGDELRLYLDRTGAKAIKMRVGAKYGAVDASIARVEAARRAIGPDIELMVDAHGTFSPVEAKIFARATESARLRWFEEPMTGDAKREFAGLRAASPCAIAGGENDFTRFDYVPYLDASALDVFQPDLGVCGGITEARRIGELAGAFQIEVSPHVWGGTVQAAASAHFAISCPSVAIFEYPAASNPAFRALASGGFALADGRLSVDDKPGLGLDLDETYIARCAVYNP
ncbi:MAG: mandelate racemase/muconate lactonizing enzyme family protein [Proteobacteria bacterium]|nr:mandelate racemase/muconate lactonizing enzyme family protein [Pseudomonadota bacterium]